MKYYEVAPIQTVRTDKPSLTYHSDEDISPGQLVRINISNKLVNGVVVSCSSKKPTYATKPIDELSTVPALPSHLLELAGWMSQYYLTPRPVAWQAILPAGLHKKRRTKPLQPQSANPAPLPALSSTQQTALQQLRNQPTKPAILMGVTGSGKTMLYLQRAQDALKNHKSTIVLVPEIGLTSQLVKEFSRHFSDVFITHSRMSESERHSTWQAIATHPQPCIIIGPRSALFSPRADLGLIVIDEFHEPSYKQDQNPKYATNRAAAVIATHTKSQLILGSATPTISERYIAEQKSAQLIRLPKPFNVNVSAQTHIIDLKKERPIEKSWLTLPAKQAIDASLAANKQVLLFHNRRGTASTSLCTECDWASQCPRCHVSMALHADWHQLRCHICNYHTKPPAVCPDCKQAATIEYRGIGTKQLEADMKALYPNKTVARFDTDTAKQDGLDQRFNEVVDGSIAIIVGTQTIAKGLDLPKLTTVVVPLADVSLRMPDYTASERTFQLLRQVAGRVGRHDALGQVFVQTYSPDHPAIQLAAQNQYDQFYEHELAERKLANYPPFTYLLKIRGEYASAKAAQASLTKLAGQLSREFSGIQILGPAPAFYEQFNDRFRWQLVVKARNRQKLLNIAESVPAKHHLDIDPSTLL